MVSATLQPPLAKISSVDLSVPTLEPWSRNTSVSCGKTFVTFTFCEWRKKRIYYNLKKYEEKKNTYLWTLFATGLLVGTIGDPFGAIQRWTLNARTNNVQCERIACAHGARIVTVGRQVRMPRWAGQMELIAQSTSFVVASGIGGQRRCGRSICTVGKLQTLS